MTILSNKKKDSNVLQPSLYRVLWFTFYRELLITGGWKLINDVVVFFSPQLIRGKFSQFKIIRFNKHNFNDFRNSMNRMIFSLYLIQRKSFNLKKNFEVKKKLKAP